MKPITKLFITGAVLCVIGGILLDCKIEITGFVCIILGFGTIIFGPLAIEKLNK